MKQAAYILVLNIGVEILLEELRGVIISDGLRFAISIGTILLALAYAHFSLVQKTRFILVWLGQGIGIFNKFIDWLFMPVKGLINLLWKGTRLLFTPRPS